MDFCEFIIWSSIFSTYFESEPKLFYENGELISKCNVKHPRDGIFKLFFSNNKLALEANYVDNDFDGVFKIYYKNGNIKREDHYVNRNLEGPAKVYYENGALRCKFFIKNNKLEGLAKGYYQNGTLEFEEPWIDGNLEGHVKHYYENGVLKYERFFKKGKKYGIERYYYTNGKLESEYSYKNDKKDGECKEFHKNGKLREIKSYKNGKLYGAKKNYNNEKLNYEYNYTNELRNGYSISNNKKTCEIETKQFFRKGELIDFCTNDRITSVKVIKNDRSDTKSQEITKDKIFISNDNSETCDKRKNNKIKNFILDLLNCSRGADITEEVINSNKMNFSIFICGDQGTGKSAYARNLAYRLGLEIITKSAADLLDQYVGNGEQKIKEAFEEARAQKAMLIIDGADSFLRSRGFSKSIWEVSMVNQMLTCLEDFEFPFIYITIDTLDQATLRRFTFCRKFERLII